MLDQDESGGIGDSYDEIDYPELPKDITPGGYVVEDPAQVILIADTMASNAEIYALHGDFHQAHTLFGIALELISVLHRNEDFEGLVEADRVFNRISEFYVDLLPPTYLDSVPAGIESFVSRYQLDGLLSSMENGEIDTTLLASFQCSESAIYNIPITYNLRVQKALTAILRSGRKNWVETLLARAHYYRPMMNDMYEEAGIPTDMTFLPILESAFDPKAYSPAHASGLWQFIPSTGRAYDLRANYWVDERRDPIKATAASIGYFTRLYGLFDDWYLSLASYNCGEGRVRRTMNRLEVDEFWDLELPRETMNYVPLYIAYQIVAKNPHCFGYEVDTTKKTYDLERVYVSDCIDLHKVADGLGITYDSLKSINPHIIQWCTPPNMDSIALYIPDGKTEQYQVFYASLSDADKVNWYRYKIQSGDVLGNIAERFDVSLSALKQINNMRSNRIIAGRYIFVPIPANSSVEETLQASSSRSSTSNLVKQTHVIRRGETLSTISLEYDVTVEQICQWNGITNAALISVGQKLNIFVEGAAPEVVAVPTPTGDKQFYTVQSGESLYTISLKLGVTVNELAAWNGKDLNRPIIQPGERLSFYGSPTTNRIVQAEQAAEVAASGEAKRYVVKSGESLYSISLNLGITVNELAAWNNKDVTNPAIYPDEELTYYTAGTEPVATTIEPMERSSESETVAQSTRTGERHNYTVLSGESLYSISLKINVSVSDLIKWNDKDSDSPVIHPGESLVYYGEAVQQSSSSAASSEQSEVATASTLSYRVKSGDSMYAISQTFGISLDQLLEANGGSSSIHPGDLIHIPVTNATPSQSSGSSQETISYRVNAGDNLWSIAGMFNVSVHEICEASNINKTAQLHPGDVLQIPVKE